MRLACTNHFVATVGCTNVDGPWLTDTDPHSQHIEDPMHSRNVTGGTAASPCVQKALASEPAGRSSQPIAKPARKRLIGRMASLPLALRKTQRKFLGQRKPTGRWAAIFVVGLGRQPAMWLHKIDRIYRSLNQKLSGCHPLWFHSPGCAVGTTPRPVSRHPQTA